MSNVENIRAGTPDWYIYSLDKEVEQIRGMLIRLEEVEIWEAYAAALHRAQAAEIASPKEMTHSDIRAAMRSLSEAQTLLERASREIANQNNESSKV